MPEFRRIKDLGDFLFGRRALYRRAFGTPDGKKVLADLYARAWVGGEEVVPGDRERTMRNVYRREYVREIGRLMGQSDEDIQKILEQAEKGYVHEPDED